MLTEYMAEAAMKVCDCALIVRVTMTGTPLLCGAGKSLCAFCKLIATIILADYFIKT